MMTCAGGTVPPLLSRPGRPQGCPSSLPWVSLATLGRGETGHRESQELSRHTAPSQPPASAHRQRPHTGALGPNQIHTETVTWPLQG